MHCRVQVVRIYTFPLETRLAVTRLCCGFFVMKTVTKLEIQKRNKNRVNVHLDDEFAFGLALEHALTLKKGQVLTQADIDRLQHLDAEEKAYERALNLLSYRARSEYEIRTKLREKEIPDDTIVRVLDRLRERNYVNDLEFTQMWVRNRETFRPRGRRMLQMELRQKGIHNDIITQVLDELDELPGALEVAQKYTRKLKGLEPFAARQKLMGHLGRKGYGFDVIREVTDQVLNAEED